MYLQLLKITVSQKTNEKLTPNNSKNPDIIICHHFDNKDRLVSFYSLQEKCLKLSRNSTFNRLNNHVGFRLEEHPFLLKKLTFQMSDTRNDLIKYDSDLCHLRPRFDPNISICPNEL